MKKRLLVIVMLMALTTGFTACSKDEPQEAQVGKYETYKTLAGVSEAEKNAVAEVESVEETEELDLVDYIVVPESVYNIAVAESQAAEAEAAQAEEPKPEEVQPEAAEPAASKTENAFEDWKDPALAEEKDLSDAELREGKTVENSFEDLILFFYIFSEEIENTIEAEGDDPYKYYTESLLEQRRNGMMQDENFKIIAESKNYNTSSDWNKKTVTIDCVPEKKRFVIRFSVTREDSPRINTIDIVDVHDI